MKASLVLIFFLLSSTGFSQMPEFEYGFQHHHKFHGRIKSFTEIKYEVTYKNNRIEKPEKALENIEYRFDERGNLIRIVNDDSGFWKSAQYFHIDYENNTVSAFDISNSSLKKRDSSLICTYIFTDSILSTILKSSSWINLIRTYEYAQGRLIKKTVAPVKSEYEGDKTEYKYDAKGNLIEEKFTRLENGTFTQKNEYDKNNFLVEKTYFNNDTTNSYVVYENDSAGNCIKQKYYQNGELNVTEINQYDSAGKKIFYSRTAKTYPEFQQYRETFDQYGNQTSHKDYNPDGTLKYWSKQVYTYDEKGNITEEIYYEKDYPKYITEYKYVYY